MAYQQFLVIKCQILFIHIYQIYMICKHILLIMFLTKLRSFFCTQLNSFKSYNVSLTIQLNFRHFFTYSYEKIEHFYFQQFNLA